jgi:hypothetical protein
MNRKKYFHMFYLDLSPAYGDSWLNWVFFWTDHREYFDCCVTCLAAKAFFFSLATHWLIMSASRSGETYNHTESVDEEVTASYEGRRVGGHILFGLVIYSFTRSVQRPYSCSPPSPFMKRKQLPGSVSK